MKNEHNERSLFDVDPDNPPQGEPLKQPVPFPLSIEGSAAQARGAAGVHVEERAAPGPPAQLPTQKAQSVRQPGGIGVEKVGSTPYHPTSGGASCGSHDGGMGADTHSAPYPADVGWTPVPHALFGSWSLPMQLAYCAARDDASAAQERDPWWAEFYRVRAASYRAEARL